ncbi:MAG TPA: hypothetical protein VGB62_03805 [Allosphingosinicella sp.]
MNRRDAFKVTGGALAAAALGIRPAFAQGAPGVPDFLAKAEAAKPVLRETLEAPLGLAEAIADPAEQLGWRIQPAGTAAEVETRVLQTGDSFIVDFGGHRTGYLSFDLIGVGRNVDAPARLRFVFGEVISDVAEPFHPYKGSLSEAWLPEETVTIDFLPQAVKLPRRYAFRFVRIEVIAASSSFGVRFANLRARAVTSAPAMPLPPLPAHMPEDLRRMDSVAAATLRDCMQTVFEDGPRRDQRLWTGDLRLQALTAYAAMPNHALVKRCLYLLAAFPRADGLLPGDVFESPEPARANDFPYDYAALYAVTLADYVEATGDTATGTDLWPVALRQIQLLTALVSEEGLFVTPNGVWIFVDWHEGLDRTAAMHAILLYALRRTHALGRALNRNADVAAFPARAAQMEKAALAAFYDRGAGVFRSGPARQVSLASQAWMTIAGVGTRKMRAAALRGAIADPAAIRPRTPYLNHYVVEALFEAGCNAEAIAMMRAYWGGMLKAGADTFWEAYSPENPRVAPYGDFHINSFCHAWSCTPSYLLRKYADRIA